MSLRIVRLSQLCAHYFTHRYTHTQTRVKNGFRNILQGLVFAHCACYSKKMCVCVCVRARAIWNTRMSVYVCVGVRDVCVCARAYVYTRTQSQAHTWQVLVLIECRNICTFILDTCFEKKRVHEKVHWQISYQHTRESVNVHVCICSVGPACSMYDLTTDVWNWMCGPKAKASTYRFKYST